MRHGLVKAGSHSASLAATLAHPYKTTRHRRLGLISGRTVGTTRKWSSACTVLGSPFLCTGIRCGIRDLILEAALPVMLFRMKRLTELASMTLTKGASVVHRPR